MSFFFFYVFQSLKTVFRTTIWTYHSEIKYIIYFSKVRLKSVRLPTITVKKFLFLFSDIGNNLHQWSKDSKYSQRSRSESHANRPKLRKIKFQKLTKKGMKQWEYYSEKNLFERDVAKSRSNLVYFPLKNLRKSGGHEKPRLGVGRPKTDRPNLCESLVYCQRLNTVISIHSPSSSLFLLPSLFHSHSRPSRSLHDLSVFAPSVFVYTRRLSRTPRHGRR